MQWEEMACLRALRELGTFDFLLSQLHRDWRDGVGRGTAGQAFAPGMAGGAGPLRWSEVHRSDLLRMESGCVPKVARTWVP